MHYVPLIPASISVTMMSSYIRWFCNKCSQIVVPSKKVKQHLYSTGVKTGMHIIPTGLDLSLINAANPAGIRKRHGIPEGAKVLLFVGRLALEKNLLFLLRSFEVIRSKEPNAYLLIAAGGPEEARLKRSAGKNVIFAGARGYPEVFDYYAASDIFVFSSLSETQGLVLAEAMASGVPQVAVDAEGVSDVVKDGVTGYLVRPSEEEFALKAVKLLEDKDLRETMSGASKDCARSVYSMEAFAKKIELLYDSVL
jgi:glycosyltransferase involved in cell wall biosynthesis